MNRLRSAVCHGNLERVRELLSEKDYFSNTLENSEILVDAVSRNHIEICQVLLQSGASPRINFSKPLVLAVQSGFAEITQLLADSLEELNSYPSDANNPYTLATMYAQQDVFEVFRERRQKFPIAYHTAALVAVLKNANLSKLDFILREGKELCSLAEPSEQTTHAILSFSSRSNTTELLEYLPSFTLEQQLFLLKTSLQYSASNVFKYCHTHRVLDKQDPDRTLRELLRLSTSSTFQKQVILQMVSTYQANPFIIRESLSQELFNVSMTEFASEHQDPATFNLRKIEPESRDDARDLRKQWKTITNAKVRRQAMKDSSVRQAIRLGIISDNASVKAALSASQKSPCIRL